MKQFKNIFYTYLRMQSDSNFQFKIEDIQNVEVFSIITEGNPGSVTVMLEIYKTQQDADILTFINKIWKQKITGARLWYIYKNECNRNMEELLSKDLTPFDNDYFYEKLERYI